MRNNRTNPKKKSLKRTRVNREHVATYISIKTCLPRKRTPHTVHKNDTYTHANKMVNAEAE